MERGSSLCDSAESNRVTIKTDDNNNNINIAMKTVTASESEQVTIKTDDSHSNNNIDLTELEKIIGYTFKDKALVEEAFTHSTYTTPTGTSYNRLEYVGDAVLNLLFSKEDYLRYPTMSAGVMTRLRASNVDTEKLARVAVTHGLHRYLRHNRPLYEDQIEKFMQDMSEYPLHSYGLIDAPKVLADIVESTIGAVFIDSGSSIDIVWKVFKDLMEPIISLETMGRHPVSELHEFCQKNSRKLKFEDLWEKSSTINVFIDGQLIGSAIYDGKKEIAHNRAAKNALDNIGLLLPNGHHCHQIQTSAVSPTQNDGPKIENFF